MSEKIIYKVEGKYKLVFYNPISTKKSYKISSIGRGFLFEGSSYKSKWIFLAINAKWNKKYEGWILNKKAYEFISKLYPNAKKLIDDDTE